MNYRNIKILVKNPDVSTKVQKFLFEHDASWEYSGKVIQYENMKYLYVDNAGKITWGNQGLWFFDHSYQEVELKEFYCIDLKPVARPRETVLIEGRKYYKDELVSLVVNNLFPVE